MSVPAEKILEKAEDSLSDADVVFDKDRFGATVNRAYYSIFYCITALLEEKGVFTKTHQGAHNKFNQLYIKTQILPQKMNNYLDSVASLRHSADYDFEMKITRQDAESAINHAREFLTATKKYFNLHE